MLRNGEIALGGHCGLEICARTPHKTPKHAHRSPPGLAWTHAGQRQGERAYQSHEHRARDWTGQVLQWDCHENANESSAQPTPKVDP
jgi:hypothetical protein